MCSLGPKASEICETEDKFHAFAGFPSVVGAVDGCHIHIKAPSETQVDYVVRTL